MFKLLRHRKALAEWCHCGIRASILVVLLISFCQSVVFAEPLGTKVAKDTERLLDAVRSDFPYSTEAWGIKGGIGIGSYAPCVNGIQPLVVFDDKIAKLSPVTSILGADTDKIQSKLTGKFIIFDCKKSELPGAVAAWPTYLSPQDQTSSHNWANAGFQAPQAVRNVIIYNSIISAVKHQEVFEVDFVLTPDKEKKSASVSMTQIRSFTPAGNVFVGKLNNETALVYDRVIPKTVAIAE